MERRKRELLVVKISYRLEEVSPPKTPVWDLAPEVDWGNGFHIWGYYSLFL